jgi:DnaJ-domain-containing protein 1
MPQLLLLLAAAALFFWIIGRYGRGSPAQTARLIRQMSGVALMGASGFMALRGAVVAAAPLFILGLGLAVPNLSFAANSFSWGRRSEGQKSSVRTGMLAMELDHDTGAMDGVILAGRFKGKRLRVLSLDELVELMQECQSASDQSASLLEAYLDRAHPDWRTRPGGSRQSSGTSPPPPGSAMSREEAYAVLGLKPNCGEKEIRAAHRQLMKQYHPDRGGSDYLAAKINQAKDILVG